MSPNPKRTLLVYAVTVVLLFGVIAQLLGPILVLWLVVNRFGGGLWLWSWLNYIHSSFTCYSDSRNT